MQEQPNTSPESMDTSAGVKPQERARTQILDNNTIEKMRLETTVFLEDLYKHPQAGVHGRGLETQEAVGQLIATLTDSEKEYEEGKFTATYQAGIGIFLGRLIDFVAEKAAQDDNEKNTEQFLATLQEKLFSWSPNITNQTSLDNQLLLTAKANREPLVQGWFGQTMVGEIAYELSFCNERVIHRLSERISSHSLPEVLDILHQLQTVGAHAAAQGDWAERGFHHTVLTLQEVAKQSSSPLLQYVVKLSLDRLEEELESPTGSVFTFHGNRAAGRVSEGLREELDTVADQLERQVCPDIEAARLYSPLPIANDAIGFFDHSVLPRYLGKVDFTTLPKHIEASPRLLDSYYNEIRSMARLQDPVKTQNIILGLSYVVPSLSSPAAWHGMYPALSERQWQKVITDLERESAHASEAEAEFIATGRGYDNQEAVMKILAPLLNNKMVFLKTLERYIKNERIVAEELLQKVHIEKYGDIPRDPRLNPFTKPEDKDLPLLLQHLHRPEVRLKIEEDLGVSLLDIPLRSQIQFLRYLSGQDNIGFERVRDVLKTKKAESTLVLKSFLANAEDARYSEALLILAERLDEKTAGVVFGKYAEITSASEKVREFLAQETQGAHNFSEEDINHIVRNMLHRCNEFLLSLSKNILGGIKQEYIIAELERMKADAILFTSTVKAMREITGSVGMHEFANVEFRTQSGQELSRDARYIDSMEQIYRQNYKDRPPEFIEYLISTFQESLKNPKARFYTLSFKGRPVAYCRFEDRASGSMDGGPYIYFGAFNTDPSFRSAKIGESMLAEVLVEESARGMPIEADCLPEAPITKKYLGEMGFSIASQADIKGEHVYHIVRKEEIRQKAA